MKIPLKFNLRLILLFPITKCVKLKFSSSFFKDLSTNRQHNKNDSFFYPTGTKYFPHAFYRKKARAHFKLIVNNTFSLLNAREKMINKKIYFFTEFSRMFLFHGNKRM